MKDIQSLSDDRNMSIDRVGVKGIKYPITVLDKAKKIQHTIADINMFVDLPHQFKGTHMSRFVEVLHQYRNEVSLQSFSKILEEVKQQLNAKSAHIEASFPYFIEKRAPVSDASGLLDYKCHITAKSNGNNQTDILVEIKIPITSLCPCSKEISDYGAHNQRGEVAVAVRFKEFFWMEDLIARVEKAGSCEVYSILKRADEKQVTEQAYDNPKFVEDIVRDVALFLEEEENFPWYSVSVENFESIHNHSAYAYICSDKSGF